MTEITVSIVSTDEAEKVVTCLRALRAQTVDATLRVVVVDNGSRDDTAQAAEREYPGVRVLRNAERRGFSENHNAALGAVPGDFGLVLNPDVVFEPGCIAELLSAAARHPRAGIVVPLLRFPTGEPQPSARRFPRLAGTLVRRTPLRRLAAERVAHSAHYLPPPVEDRMVDWALGACLFVRGEAWRALGGFDAGYRPLYVEDVDLAWRMWSAAWEVWQTPLAVAMHEHQAATDRVFLDRRTVWHARGMLRFVRQHPRILVTSRPRPLRATPS